MNIDWTGSEVETPYNEDDLSGESSRYRVHGISDPSGEDDCMYAEIAEGKGHVPEAGYDVPGDTGDREFLDSIGLEECSVVGLDEIGIFYGEDDQGVEGISVRLGNYAFIVYPEIERVIIQQEGKEDDIVISFNRWKDWIEGYVCNEQEVLGVTVEQLFEDRVFESDAFISLSRKIARRDMKVTSGVRTGVSKSLLEEIWVEVDELERKFGASEKRTRVGKHVERRGDKLSTEGVRAALLDCCDYLEDSDCYEEDKEGYEG